jgi:hypothetical protein
MMARGRVSGPHLMTMGTNTIGLRCKHFSQTIQRHGKTRRSPDHRSPAGATPISPLIVI